MPGQFAAGDFSFNGKVGIGLVNPTYSLDIFGSAPVLRIDDSRDGGGMIFVSPNAGGLVKPGVFSQAGQPLMLGSDNSVNDVVISSSGDVGIGVVSPVRKFEVVNDADRGVAYFSNDKSAGYLSSNQAIVWTETVNPVSNPSASYAIRSRYNTAEVFNVRHDGTGYLLGSAWTFGSDERLKENIKYYNEGLIVINSLKPAKFDYINGSKNVYGFIAQDVQEVLPEAVEINNATGYLGLKTNYLVPYLVNAVRELNAENELLKNRLQILEDEILH